MEHYMSSWIADNFSVHIKVMSCLSRNDLRNNEFLLQAHRGNYFSHRSPSRQDLKETTAKPNDQKSASDTSNPDGVLPEASQVFLWSSCTCSH